MVPGSNPGTPTKHLNKGKIFNMITFFKAFFGLIFSVMFMFIWIYGLWLWDNAQHISDMIVYSVISATWVLCVLLFSFYFDNKGD